MNRALGAVRPALFLLLGIEIAATGYTKPACAGLKSIHPKTVNFSN